MPAIESWYGVMVYVLGWDWEDLVSVSCSSTFTEEVMITWTVWANLTVTFSFPVQMAISAQCSQDALRVVVVV